MGGKASSPGACRWSPRRRDLLPTVPTRSPASARAPPAVGIEPRELDRWRKREEPPLGGAEFADHKTDCARLEKSPLRQRLAVDPGRGPRAYPQPLARPRQANTGQMAGLFFREFSKIAPEWVSGGISADYGFAGAFKLALYARRINGADRMPVADLESVVESVASRRAER